LIEDIDDKHATIAPLILITLVENAFKYGLASSIPKPGIRIELKVEDKVLTFSIANAKSSNDQASRRKSKIGIGIKNVKKQLFLQYPDRHELSISNQDQMYNVKLTIEL
jgi:LytS/YehU family sensor histidine kinase